VKRETEDERPRGPTAKMRRRSAEQGIDVERELGRPILAHDPRAGKPEPRR
jgi:hypothetical protein